MATSELIRELNRFGLSDLEAGIYLFLKGRDLSSILEISRNLKVARTSVYDNILKLSEKGLVERVIKYKSQQFRAAPMEMFQRNIDQEKEKIDQLKRSYDFIKTELDLIKTNSNFSTKVKYYHGQQGFQQLMWNVLSADKETVGYSVFGRVEVVGKSFHQKWIEEFKIRKLQDRVIINPNERTLSFIGSDVKPDEHQLRLSDIRSIDSEILYVSGDTTIYNNVFAVCYWEHGEIVGVEIENQELVKTQKTIFEILWKMAKPLNETSV